MQRKALDNLLTTLEVRLKAFAVCEIGADWRLNVDPVETVLCHFVVRGHGFLDVCGRHIPIAAGAIIIVPPGTSKSISGADPVAHEVSAADSCDSYDDELLVFRARSEQPSLVLGCASIAATCGGSMGLFECLREPLVAALAGNDLFAATFDALLQELSRPRAGTAVLAGCLMKQAVVLLLREEMGRNSESVLLDHLGDERIVRAVGAMIRSPGMEHTVASLAQIAGMSRSSSSRISPANIA